ncbi:hypothetical protein O4G76_14835 [Limimaricola sp. G21655-S1]|uniref:hypothetical protein n=1 Tax=Limimaricola sp. G21655-S1 TaxID=3014768 RepID=UPI0022AF1493|nr:hypothetical protein [Limimaricola sp. G21655-S1]MCZ4262119.1 hypothetical protein [Limimaricola sp. G21655-S1]
MQQTRIETDWGDDPLDYPQEAVENEHIDDVWEEFGELRAVVRSARPKEWGYFLIVQGGEFEGIDYEISFQLPVDIDGNMSGPARLVFNTQTEIIEEVTLAMQLTQSIYGEISREIKHAKQFATPDAEGEDFYHADYGIWLKRMTKEDRQLHLASV